MINTSISIEQLNQMNKSTLMETLDIEYIEIKENSIKGKMPISNKTKNPFGLLHGGASMAFSETLASMASFLSIKDNQIAMCKDIKGKHVKPAHKGMLTGIARLTKTIDNKHLWETEIFDKDNNLIHKGEVTMVIKNK